MPRYPDRPVATNHCNPLPAQIVAVGATTPSCYATADQGFPSALVTAFNPATDNITWIPKDTADSYVENYFLSVQRAAVEEHPSRRCLRGQSWFEAAGLHQRQSEEPVSGFTRPFGNWPSDITAAVDSFYSNYNALQVRYEQRMVGGLTLLNSFTWEHSLDNASASLEGNTPSPQDANNIRADYAQSDYNLPIANVTSVIYELPFGSGRRFLNDSNGVVNSLLGGWQLSAINTAQAGTPFNITYSPNSAQAVSRRSPQPIVEPTNIGRIVVPGQPVTQGRSNRAPNTGYVNYVNLAAFVLPPIKDGNGAVLSPFGNASRNPGRTPAFYQTDLAVNKKFSTPIESLKVEFRTEFYNLFNHTNLYLPGGISGTQGTTTAVLGTGGTAALGSIVGGNPSANTGQVTSTFEPRIIQFGLKVMF